MRSYLRSTSAAAHSRIASRSNAESPSSRARRSRGRRSPDRARRSSSASASSGSRPDATWGSVRAAERLDVVEQQEHLLVGDAQRRDVRTSEARRRLSPGARPREPGRGSGAAAAAAGARARARRVRPLASSISSLPRTRRAGSPATARAGTSSRNPAASRSRKRLPRGRRTRTRSLSKRTVPSRSPKRASASAGWLASRSRHSSQAIVPSASAAASARPRSRAGSVGRPGRGRRSICSHESIAFLTDSSVGGWKECVLPFVNRRGEREPATGRQRSPRTGRAGVTNSTPAASSAASSVVSAFSSGTKSRAFPSRARAAAVSTSVPCARTNEPAGSTSSQADLEAHRTSGSAELPAVEEGALDDRVQSRRQGAPRCERGPRSRHRAVVSASPANAAAAAALSGVRRQPRSGSGRTFAARATARAGSAVWSRAPARSSRPAGRASRCGATVPGEGRAARTRRAPRCRPPPAACSTGSARAARFPLRRALPRAAGAPRSP